MNGTYIQTTSKQKTRDKIWTKLKKNKKIILKSCLTIIMWTLALTSIFPFVWMVSTSFKMPNDVFSFPIKLIPDYFYPDNYIRLLTGNYNYTGMLFNSVKVTSIKVTCSVVTSILAAYGFSKLKFKGRDAVFILYLATMMVPPQLILVPKFIMFRYMNIYNTHWALILPGAFTIFGVFMLRQYMLQIPFSLSEAARIDGASELRICFRIIAPLCKPAIVTLVILLFTWSWNDYENPLIFLRDKNLFTIPLGLTNFMDEEGLKYHLIMAASVISILPIFVTFITAQKYFVGGLSAGAVKG